VVQQTVVYFTQRVRCVFLSARLGASKTFDRVDHRILFQKLIDHNTPQCLIDIIQDWYHKLTAVVRWNGVFTVLMYLVACSRHRLPPPLFGKGEAAAPSTLPVNSPLELAI